MKSILLLYELADVQVYKMTQSISSSLMYQVQTSM